MRIILKRKKPGGDKMNYKKKISIGIIFILVLLAGNSTIYAENFRETDMFMPTDEEDYYDTGIP